MKPRVSALYMMKLPGPGQYYKLIRDLTYEDDECEITCPAGMVADGNSGPIRDAERDVAGWVHDLTYRKDALKYIKFKTQRPRYNRRWADQIYRRVALTEGTSRFDADIDYWTLRLLGRSSWHKNVVGF